MAHAESPCPRRSGATIWNERRRSVATQSQLRQWSRPLYAQGHLAILRGNLAEEGAVAKITGVKTP